MATAYETGRKEAQYFMSFNHGVVVTTDQFSNRAIDSAYKRYKTDKSQQEFIRGWLSVEIDYLFGLQSALVNFFSGLAAYVHMAGLEEQYIPQPHETEEAEAEPTGSDNPDAGYIAFEEIGYKSGTVLVGGHFVQTKDITVRNVPELPETVYVRFLSDDSGVFVTHGENGYNALKALADKTDAEAFSGAEEDLVQAAAEVFGEMEPGEEDSAAARTGRKIIDTARTGETVVFTNEHLAIRKGGYSEERKSDYGVWLKTSENTLTFVTYKQIMGVEKAPADIPAPESEPSFNPTDVYKFLDHYKRNPIYITPNAGTIAPEAALRVPGGLILNPNLETRRADLARRRAELEAEEQRLDAEQALTDIVVALDPKNEFYISSLTLKCKTCGAPLMLAFGPTVTPVHIAQRLRECATSPCHVCLTNFEIHGGDDIDNLEVEGLEPLTEEDNDRILAAQEQEDFEGYRALPVVEMFDDEPF